MQAFTGKQYLQMDIAAHFGLDKENWDTRLNWFNTHKDVLEGLLKQADVPAQYFASVHAWRQVEQGLPIGYAIALDATASGMQILACLTGDRRAAMLCNVINVGRRVDAYTEVYTYMQMKVGQQGRITREMVKSAVMTSLYNSEAIPKRVFGTGPLLTKFYETMEEECPAVWELNQYYKAIWDCTRDTYEWVLPDNFHVVCKVTDYINEQVLFLNEHYDVVTKVHGPTAEGRSLSANTTHSIDGMIVREIGRRCNYKPTKVIGVINALNDCEAHDMGADDADSEMVRTLWERYQKSGYLSARILDHIHLQNAGIVDYAVVMDLIQSLPDKPFEVFSIHDCFRCLPNYGNDLRQQYRLQLHLIAKSRMLSDLLSQLMGHQVDIEPLDANLADEILQSEYALS
ncbi:DNA-dependent RNA polymerase [compost metagenome]